MDHFAGYVEAHSLDSSGDYEHIKSTVIAVVKANEAAHKSLADIDSKTNRQGFVIQAHLNLIGRLGELAEGMLAALATNCFAASEALARVVVEGSINLMFLSNHTHDTTLLGYIESWVTEHDRKLTKWRDDLLQTAPNAEPLKQVEKRISMLEGHKQLLEQFVLQFGLKRVPIRDAWPKRLFDRFSRLGKEHDYYSTYHRLSSASHLAAEDTLTWPISLGVGNPALHEALGKEAIAYSIMMSRVAGMYYIESLAMCCASHGMIEDEPFASSLETLATAIREIS